MKKLIKLLLLSITCCLLVLVGCKEEVKNNLTTITIWHYYSNTQAQAFTSKVDEFNSTKGKEKGIYVEEYSLGKVVDLETALFDSANKEVGASTFPDLFMAYADTAYQLDLLGKVASVNNYFTNEELSGFNKEFLNEGMINGDLKIIPIAKSTEALYINKTDFDGFVNANPTLNITLNDLSTIEGVVRVAQEYYDWCGKAFYGRDSLSNYFVSGSKQLGVDLFDYDNENKFYVNFDKDIFRKLYDNYYIPSIGGSFYASNQFASTALHSGNIICYTGSTSSSPFFPKQVVISDSERKDIECYVMPAPLFKDATNTVAISQGAGMVVAKNEEVKERAAVEFLKWFTNIEINLDFATMSSYMPVINNALTDEFINKTEGVSKQTFNVCKNIISTHIMYTNVPSKNGSSIRSILDKTLNELIFENKAYLANSLTKGGTSDYILNDFLSDEHFEQWYESLKKKINAYL